jgi:Domain of unknown function (DUF4126)
LGVIQLLGSTLGLGLVSGINLYATVLVVGLGIRFDLIVLRPELRQLEILANPVVIVVAGLIFVVELTASGTQCTRSYDLWAPDSLAQQP